MLKLMGSHIYYCFTLDLTETRSFCKTRTELCTQLAWVLEQGSGIDVHDDSDNTAIRLSMTKGKNSAIVKLNELRTRMNTIRSSANSSVAAVQEAAIAADMSGRVCLVETLTESTNNEYDEVQVTDLDFDASNESEKIEEHRASFMAVVAKAPSTELELPAPLLHYHNTKMADRRYSQVDTTGRTSSTELEVPAPTSPMRGSPLIENRR